MSETKNTTPFVEGQLVEGNCIIAVDAPEFARVCADKAKELAENHPELAKIYLQSMGGLSLKMENCNPTHTTTYPPRHG